MRSGRKKGKERKGENALGVKERKCLAQSRKVMVLDRMIRIKGKRDLGLGFPVSPDHTSITFD